MRSLAGTWDGKQIPGIGEWIMNNASIPVADYKALAPKFNPVGFSAHDIVALAKSAGMKYIVITSKHHDGFAMFDSKANPFNIVAATAVPSRPAEGTCGGVPQARHQAGILLLAGPGLDGAGRRRRMHGLTMTRRPAIGDKAQDGDFSAYVHAKTIPQLKELLTNYGDFPAVIWFDTPKQMTPQDAADIVTLLNGHPQADLEQPAGRGL